MRQVTNKNTRQSEVRACIESFVDDVAQMVGQAIRLEVTAALDRLQEERVAAPMRRSRRNGAGKRQSSNGAGKRQARPNAKKRQSSQLELSLDSESGPLEPEPPPAPLFVHKRARDGKIQHLSRSAGDSEPPRQNDSASP